ncbi:CYTH and CHAD domain-containing protein [Mycolicibacterium sp. 050158]|uniref:CYTH and CHAD domain-containing protein n=1 Tax=Mycolicibacterium sp. 050158 TaxID=3090602 RepID=UPI00299F4479|nr:CYTH and CHAD domain-containing protein [Mycolicibacterium sp. 050158]MDX1893301.1 CYTH and CHAD domain-containing protein [Mycolicibacterium sp. 050158]
MPADKRNPSRHTEVERKFAVGEASVSPSFEGLSAVARVQRSPVQHLDAVYYDTPDHDLAAQRVTLRRRTGGPDAGWHLKLPAGPDARTEVRLPLGDDGAPDDTVPEELRDVVLAIVRDRPLRPVARISTSRTVDMLYGPDGNALAEFCDDTVQAAAEGDDEPQQWREWELELTEDGGGDDALLDRLANRLFDAGAEPAGHGSKLAKVLGTTPAEPVARAADPVHRAVAEQIQELLRWDRAVRADVWDSVHQMRVTTRKIRSLLRASEDSFGIADDSWLLEELKELAGILGVARDAEVLAEKYEKALDGLPDELVRGPVRERLVEGAKRRYHSGWKRSLVAMRSERYFRLLDGLDELVAVAPPQAEPGAEPEPLTVDAAYQGVRKAAKKAAAAAADETVSAEHADEALHKIRKRAKQLRYTASALSDEKAASAAKTIQTLLGDHQDSVVSRTHLSEEAIAAHAAGEDTFTYGVLYQLESEVAERAEERLGGALKALKKAVRSAK